MLKVGITGGIGSGKTTVCKIFELLGIPFYSSDKAAQVLMENHEELRSKIIFHFGKSAYHQSKLNKTWLTQNVFTVPQKLNLLNSLVHPIVLIDSQDWMKRQTSAYAIKESALIFESNAFQYLDQVIGVAAPKALRIVRSMSRNKISMKEVLLRMERQMAESKKLRMCDFILVNNEKKLLIPQILELHEKLLHLSHS